MNSEANKLLEELEADASAIIPRPASEADIEECQWNLEELKLPPLPDDYIEFLQICNGIAWNGVEFHGTGRVKDNNSLFVLVDLISFAKDNAVYYEELLDLSGLLFIGRSDEDLFVFNRDRGMYEIYETTGMDVMEEYKYFENLFLATVGGRYISEISEPSEL
jgi:hypothetical protein